MTDCKSSSIRVKSSTGKSLKERCSLNGGVEENFPITSIFVSYTFDANLESFLYFSFVKARSPWPYFNHKSFQKHFDCTIKFTIRKRRKNAKNTLFYWNNTNVFGSMTEKNVIKVKLRCIFLPWKTIKR